LKEEAQSGRYMPLIPEAKAVESTQLAGWYFELIFVDFETLDFRIERSCRQP
jgi:hypothetical protein